MLVRLTIALVLTLGATAGAAEHGGLIAVLPLDVTNTDGKMSKAAQASFEEMLRDVATDALASAGWTVLSTQNQLQILADNGVNAAHCGDESCHLAMAREIKAEKFISGAVQFVEGQFTASVRLIDSTTGRIVISQRVSAKTVTELRELFESKAAAFFTKANLTAKPTTKPDLPPAKPGETATLAGTDWGGTDSDGDYYVFQFLPDGVLHFKSPTGDYKDADTWEQHGSTVTFQMTDHYSEYTGVISGSTIAGKATNKAGREWTWSVTKQ